MNEITKKDFERNFTEIINRIQEGDDFILTFHGVKVASLSRIPKRAVKGYLLEGEYIPQEQMEIIFDYLRNDKKIMAIKEIRALTGASLKTAKYFVDDLVMQGGF